MLTRRVAFVPWLVVCLLVWSGSALAQAPGTEEQKTLYALGLAVAQNLKAFALTPEEVKMVSAGLNAGLTNQKPAVELDAYKEKIDALAETRIAARAAREREA
ncbi:MAG: hypothetical protein ACREJT_14510, partial [Myxococcota bacterium]